MAAAGIRVHKLGGSVLADAASIEQAVQAVVATQAEAAVVVVSACAGVTDTLHEIARYAAVGDVRAAHRMLEQLYDRHREYADHLLPAAQREQTAAALGQLIEHAMHLCRGVAYLRELTPRMHDALLAFGELLASRLLADVFSSLLGSGVLFVDARDCVVTDATFGRARPQLPLMQQRLRELGLLEQLQRGGLLVTQGFVGATPEGMTTTLGRGGSDLSAALFAVAVGAEEVVIWKDVPGVFTADPDYMPEAEPIPMLSAAHMRALALAGARVLHPDTLGPAMEHGIGIRIRGVRQPTAPGTLVVAHWEAPPEPLALAWRTSCEVYTAPTPEAARTWTSPVELGIISRMGTLLVTESPLAEPPAGWESWRRPQALLSLVGHAPERWALSMVEHFLRARLACSGIWLGDSPAVLRFLVPQETWPEAAQCLHLELLHYRHAKLSVAPAEG